MLDWPKHVIWWHLYPLGFVGAEPEALMPDALVVHRLPQLTNWLDYVVELGASGLLLGPIFASSTHGYDTLDHFRIDPRLGDSADFHTLVAAAKSRGIRVLLDGVFNHVGQDFPVFQRVLAEGPDAPHASWFRLSWPQDWRPGMEPEYADFEGHRQLVTLNHAEPAVRDYVANVMAYWLDRGADGWRLDAAYAVPRHFWADVLARIREHHPDAWFVGEVIHGDYAGAVREGGMDTVTQYELWKAIWSSLNDGNCFELAWALDRHNRFLDAFVPLTFLGNHDVTRIASRLKDSRNIAHALAILMTCGGTPAIYAGDEQAFRGIKEERAGGDDAIRPEFPETPEGLSPLGWSVYRLHQDLIGLRRRHAWLHTARTRIVRLANRHLVYEAYEENHRLLVALNLDDMTVELPAPFARIILAGAGTLLSIGTTEAAVQLPAQGWAIISDLPPND